MEPTRAWITGECDGLDALARELEAAGVSVYRVAGMRLELAAGLAAARPDVVLHGAGGRPAGDDIAALREHTQGPVVLVTTDCSPSLVDDAIAAGVADVLLLPQPVEGVLFALRKLAHQREQVRPRSDGKVVTVFSPKGGTGKSVTATNLAVALAKHQG